MVVNRSLQVSLYATHIPRRIHILWTHALSSMTLLDRPGPLHSRNEYISKWHSLNPLLLILATYSVAVRQRW